NVAGLREQRVIGVVKPAAKPMVVPDQAGRIERTASAADRSTPVFHGLFRSTGAPEPVAPVISALWGNPATPAPAAAPAKPQPLPEPPAAAATGGALDLFQERIPDARALFRGRV